MINLLQASDSLLIPTIIAIGLFILIIGVWVNFDDSKKKKETNKWSESESGKDILNVPNLFDSIILEIETQIPLCSKCSSQLHQFWELIDNTLIIRCTTCKKKTNISVDETIVDGVNLFIDYVQIAYSHENEFTREKMIKEIYYDFDGLRKGTPLIRAIVFRATGENVNIIVDRNEDKRSRRISQQVKDKVWRRDEGKCVECGTNQNLEFDHIIPHSKGGGNTYRNIQLLCESCNRSKSAKIG